MCSKNSLGPRKDLGEEEWNKGFKENELVHNSVQHAYSSSIHVRSSGRHLLMDLLIKSILLCVEYALTQNSNWLDYMCKSFLAGMTTSLFAG